MDESVKQLAEAGYQVRPARFEDLPQLVPMFNAAEAELTGAGDYTVERYREEWQQTGIDLEASTRWFLPPMGRWSAASNCGITSILPSRLGFGVASTRSGKAAALAVRCSPGHWPHRNEHSIGYLKTRALPLTSPHRPTIDLASSSSKAWE